MFYVIQAVHVTSYVVWRHLPEQLDVQYRCWQLFTLHQTMYGEGVIDIW